MQDWAKWIYQGSAKQRALAAKLARTLAAEDGWFGCAVGDVAAVEAAIRRDAPWVNRPGGVMGMPPMVAVTHSWLILEPGFEDGLLACARALLAAGADVDSSWTDPNWPESPLSALYGAAGKTHHAGMLGLLLRAGANPNDGESLYHSLEAKDSTCTRMLLAAGARVTDTNAIAHVMDVGKLDDLRLLVERRKQEPAGGKDQDLSGTHFAILRGRGIEYVQVLLDAGADPRGVNRKGISLFRWAAMFGREDVVALLRERGVAEELSEEEAFVAACARDEARDAGMVARLNPAQLKALPRMADLGDLRAVRAMLDAGWPLETKGEGGFTALNLAVFRGNAEMTRLLMEHGADWRTQHGYGDNVCGTLSYASREDAARDFTGCARALVEGGVPVEAFAGREYAEAVQAYLDELTESK